MGFDRERSEQLSRLALCPSAPQGEWQAAALAYFRAVRAAGATAEELQELSRPEPPEPPSLPPTRPQSSALAGIAVRLCAGWLSMTRPMRSGS